ncbi:hypothetical protein N7489_011185 [Penicillium chrysogenum]|uniref:UspA domain-containing protein n=1 Tax=Penicillium chrysogenum TaxID=5076 RepID=A0ABQ8WD37_PENCH|nr:uncharacterized protein N7489_011185 [Penicillium chrysogenum]KAJ5230477.1 hypothetical protein N7489_011185 [Penicillium chrysogenum]KAJ5264326.1 hypothetical protein N7505_008247 [Penicillium chrysogenum]KAJ5272149.1 hypothetical protein N7524_005418 [Penicillium chrysogenum]KAJ6163290.1 hypothetical protein N7497_003269 [Penicillium chrysogenum]
MVIAIMIGRSTPEIVLESAKRTQVVIIGKWENNHLYLRSQPLIVGFDKLFLRPPSTPRERIHEILKRSESRIKINRPDRH